MRFGIVLALLVLVAGLFLFGLRRDPSLLPSVLAEKRKPAPDFTLPILPPYRKAWGETLRLSRLFGRPIVLNFWASWCPPCRRELPMMVRLAQENPEVRFACVSQGEGPLVVKNFLEERGLSPEWVLLDPETRLAQALGIQGLPTTFFFDREGRLVARHLGELSEALLLGYLRVLR